jgi:hypothetical protein
MPIYQYQCDRCGAIDELKLHMEDSKPKGMSCSNGCCGIMWRKFTIPGLFVPYVDEWVVRLPGEVGRERRDMEWRRQHRPEIYEDQGNSGVNFHEQN